MTRPTSSQLMPRNIAKNATQLSSNPSEICHFFFIRYTFSWRNYLRLPAQYFNRPSRSCEPPAHYSKTGHHNRTRLLRPRIHFISSSCQESLQSILSSQYFLRFPPSRDATLEIGLAFHTPIPSSLTYLSAYVIRALSL